jgi:hypothetical protein
MSTEQACHPAVLQDRLERELRAGHAAGRDISLVDLVLLACDASGDAGEVGDVVGALIGSGAARILPLGCDPMLEPAPTGTSWT